MGETDGGISASWILNVSTRTFFALADFSILDRCSCDIEGIYVEQENERKGETTGGNISKRAEF
jgi:hypothetical protein